jgi:hypothetical protein
MLEARTKISERMVRAKGREYSQLIIYLPKDLVKDSAFPFEAGDLIEIRIEGQGLRIEKIAEAEQNISPRVRSMLESTERA